ncbi:MFS transporter [Ramlibacter sp. G-1-2-2]|uniref:MFS transporter n=1 Tax=Ramlibacter agri TaxID=2728837 RepID=A0A848H6K1_9BURK|nr:MFS transporter [Ramlibacter agri]NML44940.1 MFS transporter [Ramlibacter agri]
MQQRAAAKLPAGVWALGFTSLLMDVSSELIHSLLPVFLVTTLGASMVTVGLLEGAAEATALVVKVFSGVWSDWIGRRKPLALLGYGLAAVTKPLFALATGTGMVVAARLIDRVGKGIRGAPRDAMVADFVPAEQRGAAYGLRQALDTVGAFTGPLLAIAFMLLWADNIRLVFWIAVVPAFLSVAVLLAGVHEPPSSQRQQRGNPISRENLRLLPPAFWWVAAVGALFTLARFSEAFLVLRAQQGGLALHWVPLVLIVMNVVYALGAYPLGKLADSMSHRGLLATGLVVLVAADLLLASANHGGLLWSGIALWGLHMAMTQGLLATMVADTAPAQLRGTAFGMFNLASGIALLLASGLAGWLWEHVGAPSTFLAGAGLSVATLLLLAFRRMS